MELKRTARGFAFADFTDRNGEPCSIQDSSLATDDAIWLGLEHIDATHWLKVAGVNPQSIPARMHLTRAMAAALIPLLQRFVETGTITEEQ